MQVTIKGRVLDIAPLEAVRVVGVSVGFDHIDVEPYPDHVVITATGPDSMISVSGKTEGEACEAFVKRCLE